MGSRKEKDMEATLTRTGAISADSHVTEPPNLFVDHLEPRSRDRAPHMIRKEGSGEVYVIPGMKTDVPYDDVVDSSLGQ